MSVSAGRVLLMGKGTYSASTAYSPMDWVTYQGSSYVCKQASTGNLPTNTTYWQLLAEKGEAGEVTEAELEEVVDDIASLSDYIGYIDPTTVGVEVDFVNGTFKRLGAAEGLSAGANFDQFNAFGGRKRCNVADDGTINAYYGGTGYIEDGTNGQVMVYQPKFYYKMVPLKLEKTSLGYHVRKAAYYISDVPAKGFKIHPAFLDASGNEMDYILVGAAEGCLYDVSASAYITNDAQVMDNTADKFSSIFGVKPASGLTQDLTRVKIEQMCQNRGSKWHLKNAQVASMDQLLMLVEYATFDIQRQIGKGVVDITDNSSYNCSAITGSTASLGNASGMASSTNVEIGGTTTAYTVDGKTSISYRGEENLYGNIWEFIIGINVYGDGSMQMGVPYICTDYAYAESKNTDNYKSVGFMLPAAGNWQSALGYAGEDMDWAMMPSEATNAGNALPIGDYVWGTASLNAYRIARLGGVWGDGWYAGAFYWSANYAVGDRSRYLSGRVICLA